MDEAEWVALERDYEERWKETEHLYQKIGDIHINNKLALTAFKPKIAQTAP